MLERPRPNGHTLPRSAAYVKTPLRFDRQSALVDGPTNGCTQESWHSRQVLCRELTLVAASGSERPSSPNRPGGRVDFIPNGLEALRYSRGLQVKISGSLGLAFQGRRALGA